MALDEGIEEFDDGNGRVLGVAFREVVAFEHPGDGHFAGEIQHVAEGHLGEPLAVEAHLGFRAVEDFEGLFEVGCRVGFDFGLGQHRAGRGTAGGVADHGGEVADDEHGLVAEVLELAQLVKDDEVPEGEVGPRGVHAEFDAQGPVGAQAFAQFIGADEVLGVALKGGEVVGHEGNSMKAGKGKWKKDSN